MSIRIKWLNQPIMAVIVASVTASAMAWFFRYRLRKAATWRLNFTTKAPYRPCPNRSAEVHGILEHITHSKDTKDNEEEYLEEVPIPVVGHLEQYKLPAAVRVHRRKGDGRNQGAEETSPHRLDAEDATHFLVVYFR